MLVGQPNLDLIRASKCWSFVHAARSFNLEICTTTSWPRLRQCTWYRSPLCRESRHPPESKSGVIDADNPIFISLKELTSYIDKRLSSQETKEGNHKFFLILKFWRKKPVLALSCLWTIGWCTVSSSLSLKNLLKWPKKMWFSAKS